MYSLKLLAISLVLTLSVSACVAPKTNRVKLDDGAVANEARKQRELAIKIYSDQDERLYKIAWPLLRANADLCEDNIKNSFGFMESNIYYYKDEGMQQAARSVLELDSHVRFKAIVDNSPIQKAGIQVGDKIKKINGTVVPATKGASKIMADIFKTDADKVIWEFEIENESGDTAMYSVTSDQVCDYGVSLTEDDTVNAYADGNNIFITQGMMRFATTEKELSLVVGHEVAHNIMGHIDAKTTNYVLGTVLDILVAAAIGVDTGNAFGNAAAGAYSQDFEAEADYVGLYLMVKTGYELEGSADFWRKMAAIHPGNIASNHSSSHPATPERFLAIEKSVEEINNKIANNQPLEFELKPREEVAESPSDKLGFGS